ncbi:plasmid replication protein RepC [Antarcticimicrobium sediminis]|uniref:plasmid replication protein RepC n=1 Tax=Antarcticimicrobium sediminis TaxID=2546227 RepID=UPI003CCADCE9
MPDRNPAATSPTKWDLLKALTEAADDFDLSHRTLNVLRALMTFLPGNEIPQDPCAATVFPANRTLSARLNGMPESTLRRHLSRLVALGIVNRHDSPNRKRYARKMGQGIALAFGFDLSPLAEHATHVLAAARHAAARRQRLQLLRDTVARLRQDLLEHAGDRAPQPLLDEVRLVLRRKPDEAILTQLQDALTTELQQHKPMDTPKAPPFASIQLGAPDSQNERHIQDSDKLDSDSERPMPQPLTNPSPEVSTNIGHKAERSKDPTLPEVLNACSELRSFFPNPIQSWPALLETVDCLVPMLNIDRPVMQDAMRKMGARQAALAVICILERSASIHRPGAYLRRLSQKADAGKFSVLPMLNALLRREPSENCQLAT